MDFKYVLSSQFDYSKMICEDAGPAFAQNMFWQTIGFNELDKSKHHIFLIDPRLEEEEFLALENMISSRKNAKFGICIIDPGFQGTQKPIWRFTERIYEQGNVFFLFKYPPFEATADLVQKIGDKRFFVLPFPYNKEKELATLNDRRKNKVIVSGNINKNIYPHRYAIWRKSRRSLLRLFVDVLIHPGYSDVGQQNKHSIIGNKYLQYLAQYRFMFLTGSKGNLELLKFNECIYAGCAPFGVPPDSYPDEIKELFIIFEPDHIYSSMIRLYFTPQAEIDKRIQLIQNWLRENRSPETLNKRLNKFLFDLIH